MIDTLTKYGSMKFTFAGANEVMSLRFTKEAILQSTKLFVFPFCRVCCFFDDILTILDNYFHLIRLLKSISGPS